jgi:signal transduction histidine kinase
MKARTDSLVFVVDDDPASLKLSERILLGAGYWNLQLFSDPRQALDAFDPVKVDLVISDLQMPEIDGFHLLGQLRDAIGDEEFLPILVVTADATAETKRTALMLGADDFLTKPIDIVEMSLRVRHLLELRSLHSTLAVSNSNLEALVAERTAELETSLQSLENLVNAKEVFIASVSHELRTPLTAVLGFAKELSSGAADFSSQDITSMASVIAAQAGDLSAIIDDLLVAARSDINAVRVLHEDLDLLVELSAVVATLPEADRSRVRLPDTGLTVQGDRLRTRQIIRNLVTNALRHGGPSVWLELDATADIGRLTVVDNGPGIPDDTAQRLFEPYFHGRGDTGQPASMGLGLTVSRLLAHLMDGDLSLVPHPSGTAFQLALPLI